MSDVHEAPEGLALPDSAQAGAFRKSLMEFPGLRGARLLRISRRNYAIEVPTSVDAAEFGRIKQWWARNTLLTHRVVVERAPVSGEELVPVGDLFLGSAGRKSDEIRDLIMLECAATILEEEYDISNEMLILRGPDLVSREAEVTEIASVLGISRIRVEDCRWPEGDGPPFRPRWLTPSVLVRDPELRRFAEEDEAAWKEVRARLCTQEPIESPSVELGQRCFVDATHFAPMDIRHQLCLHDTVCLALPVIENLDKFWSAGGVTQDELVNLVARGRVLPVMLKAVDQYDPSLARTLLEAGGLIGPRALGGLAATDLRRRNPLYFADDYSDFAEAVSALRSLDAWGDKTNTYLDWLVDSISRAPNALNVGGIEGLQYTGIGGLLANAGALLAGPSAGLAVHAAAGLKATIYPRILPGKPILHTDGAAIQAAASLYSGQRLRPVADFEKTLQTFLPDILTISNDIPIADLDQIVASGERVRLRGILASIADATASAEEIEGIVGDYNSMIDQLKTAEQQLAKWDLRGLALAAIGALLIPGGKGFVVPWLIARLAMFGGPAVEEMSRGQAGLSESHDAYRGLRAGMIPADVVLVARIRERADAIRRQ